MKILIAINGPLTYSIAPSSRLIYIAKSLKKKGFNVEVLGGKSEKINGLKTTTVTGKKQILRLKIPLLIYKKAATQKYTHVIVRGVDLAFFLLPLKFLTTKIILDFHEWMYREIKLYYEKSLYNKFKVVIYYLIEKIVVRYSDIVICVSKGVRELLNEREKKKSVVLENGLDIKEALNIVYTTKKERKKTIIKHSLPENAFLLGFMGNWERQLDMESVFKACKIAKVNIIVIGEGPGITFFKDKWKSNVLFTKRLPRAEALKIISVCDAAIVPYKDDETVPVGYFSQRKVKDYLGLGKPILMANVKGRERFLIPYENVIFYHPSNIEDLAQKIRIIMSDEKITEKMRKNNITLARRFNWQVLVEKSGIIEKLRAP